MPHLTVEYSANIAKKPDTKKFLKGLHETLVSSGPYTMADIKSRMYEADQFQVSDGRKNQAFVHVKLAIMPGRSEDIRKQTSDNLLAYIQQSFVHENCSFSVDIREMDKAVYGKTITGAM